MSTRKSRTSSQLRHEDRRRSKCSAGWQVATSIGQLGVDLIWATGLDPRMPSRKKSQSGRRHQPPAPFGIGSSWSMSDSDSLQDLPFSLILSFCSYQQRHLHPFVQRCLLTLSPVRVFVPPLRLPSSLRAFWIQSLSSTLYSPAPNSAQKAGYILFKRTQQYR